MEKIIKKNDNYIIRSLIHKMYLQKLKKKQHYL